ncbi:transporter substrate-binding domain-containing protein [Brachyspira sp.]|uniref:transporter substrate-binding domain-containing protein n=1 Tax=Brachyspira sp. TaxID=1977261 RepID=UPI00260D6EA5|nr:transporter substrate-binding domain-containing protein [Brachyspira sp.]
MKKIILVISIIILLSSCKENTQGKTSKELIKKKKFNVGIYVYDYPFGYLSNENIRGFDYDLINEIARISKIKINLKPMKFEEFIPSLKSGRIDMIIAAMNITEKRKEELNFSHKYYTSSQAVLVKKDNDTINTEKDLIGKNVGVIRSTVADSRISQKDEININRFDSGGSIILALKIGNIDAAVFDKATCDYYLLYDNDIKLVESIEYPKEDYAIAFRKNDTELLNEINKSLSQIMTNGFQAKLVEKHLGTN